MKPIWHVLFTIQFLHQNMILVSDRFIQNCISCNIQSSPGQKDHGQMSLQQCKTSCLNEAGCTSIDYGKNKKAGTCYFNYGGKITRANSDNTDGYILKRLLCKNSTIHKFSTANRMQYDKESSQGIYLHNNVLIFRYKL